MPRKPVAATVVGTLLVVVCDDGSVWELDPNGRWLERAPVPGTEAGAVRGEPAVPDEAGAGWLAPPPLAP